MAYLKEGPVNSANSHTCEQCRYDTSASFRLALGRPKLRPLRGLVRRPSDMKRKVFVILEGEGKDFSLHQEGGFSNKRLHLVA